MIYVCKQSYHTRPCYRTEGHSKFVNENFYDYSIVIVVSFTILTACVGDLRLIILAHS